MTDPIRLARNGRSAPCRVGLAVMIGLGLAAGATSAHIGFAPASSKSGAFAGSPAPPSAKPGPAAPPTTPGGAAPAPAAAGNPGTKGGAKPKPSVTPGDGTWVRSDPGTHRGANRNRSSRGERGKGSTRPAIDRLAMWEFWWEHNDDRLLDLRSGWGLPGRRASTTGTLGILTARGRRQVAAIDRLGDRDAMRVKAAPVLLDLALRDDEPLLVNAALLTMARMTPREEAGEVLPAMVSALGHDDAAVRATAALSLGVLGSPRASAWLRGLVRDDPGGRRLVGGGSVGWLTRGVAALSLGLIGTPQDADFLIEAFDDADDSDVELRIAIVTGLGLVERSGQHRITAFLLEALGDRSLDPAVAARIPVALARQEDPAVAAPLASVLRDPDTHSFVLQSAAIALGRLAHPDDARILEALMDLAREGRDEHARHFALIALGRLGERREGAGLVPGTEGAALLTGFLIGEMEEPSHLDGRSFVSIAAALLARGLADDAPREDLARAVHRAYMREKDPNHKNAHAVALGLIGARDAGHDVLADLRDREDEDFRGYAAIALGLLDHSASGEDLRAMAADPTASSTLRRQAATGLALLGDRLGTVALLDMLSSEDTAQGWEAVTRALGTAGDPRSAEHLLALAADEDADVLPRAFACVAMGLVCEVSPLPWHARVAEDSNYVAPSTLMELVLGVL